MKCCLVHNVALQLFVSLFQFVEHDMMHSDSKTLATLLLIRDLQSKGLGQTTRSLVQQPFKFAILGYRLLS